MQQQNTNSSFRDLFLCKEIQEALLKKGYKQPSAIQEKAIPAFLSGRDIIGAAQTGTGKTAAFVLPILDTIKQKKENQPISKKEKAKQASVLIITPTRELAAQIGESIQNYSQFMSISSLVTFGGVSINPQKAKLQNGVDILVATPGRLLDLYQQQAVKFDYLQILVLDEADRMLDMGFIHDIRKIMTILPKERQSALFSATFSKSIRSLAKELIKDPVEISIKAENVTVDLIKQAVYAIEKKQKTALLIHLIKEENWYQVLVFTRTKHGADRLVKALLKNKIDAIAIHGNKSQNARTRALSYFKDNKVQVLVATDIAARGLDINQLPHVVNFDLPNAPEDYIHRIGRTGRAGAKGEAVSFVSEEETKELRNIEKLTKQEIPLKKAASFDASNVPEIRPPRHKSQDKTKIQSKRSGSGLHHNKYKTRKRSNQKNPGQKTGALKQN